MVLAGWYKIRGLPAVSPTGIRMGAVLWDAIVVRRISSGSFVPGSLI